MNKKIKVLYFVDRLLIGGIQTFILNNIKNMDRTNIQIDFLILDDGNRYDAEEEVRKLGCNVYVLDGVWLNSAIDFINYRKKLKEFFKNHHDYKVVHLHSSSKNYMFLKYAKKYGVPIRIAHAHSLGFQTNNKIKRSIGKIFNLILRKYATDYFACSYEASKISFGKKDAKIIRNAVDYNKFSFDIDKREMMRKNLNISSDDVVYGNVGRICDVKNHDFLVDVFYELQNKNKNSKLLLVGTGELEEKIKNKVKELKIEDKVIFVGFTYNVCDYMQAMDAFIFPSKSEGLGLVLIEAQTNGLKCFTSKEGVPKEADITNTVSYISFNNTAKEWSEIILSFDVKRFDNRDKIKESGYLIEDTAKKLEEFYINS